MIKSLIKIFLVSCFLNSCFLKSSNEKIENSFLLIKSFISDNHLEELRGFSHDSLYDRKKNWTAPILYKNKSIYLSNNSFNLNLTFPISERKKDLHIIFLDDFFCKNITINSAVIKNQFFLGKGNQGMISSIVIKWVGVEDNNTKEKQFFLVINSADFILGTFDMRKSFGIK